MPLISTLPWVLPIEQQTISIADRIFFKCIFLIITNNNSFKPIGAPIANLISIPNHMLCVVIIRECIKLFYIMYIIRNINLKKYFPPVDS